MMWRVRGVLPWGVFAVLLVFATVAFTLALNGRGQQVAPLSTATPSPTPSTTSPSATIASSTTAPSSASSRSGLISRNGDGPIVVRTESDPAPVRTVPSFLISSDGLRVPYWTEGPSGAELHVIELGGNDRVIKTFAALRPGGIAWSTDETGLLVSLAEPNNPTFPLARIVMAVDIASGASREIYRGTGPSGAGIVPLVWRRNPEVFAAYETGPGGFTFGYTVVRPGEAPVRTEPDAEVIGMAASTDGALIFGQWIRESGLVKVWPVEDFSKKTELVLAAGETMSQPRWWPGRNEIAFLAGRVADGTAHDRRIERWDPVTGMRTVLLRLPDAAQLGAYLIRADGSGVLTLGPYPPGAWQVTDLQTGATATIPQLPGENILRTVLLPSAPTPTSATAPTGFALPAGCAFVGSPVVGSGGTQWQFDCGSTANRDARGTLASAFTQQGWISCGAVTATATWMKGDLRLLVAEGAGGSGPNALPTLTQPAGPRGTACG